MWNATIKGLLAHKLRLGLTALAIVLGVTFVSGTLVLTDTLKNTFSVLFGHIYQNIDFEISAKPAFGNGNGNGGGPGSSTPIPQSIVSTVRSVPGVAAAVGTVGGYAQLVSPAGKAIVNGGAPTIGLSFDGDGALSALSLVQGSAPTTPGEVVIDAGTAAKYHFHPGDNVRVLLSGPPQTFTISGIVRFGTADDLAGATITAFDLTTAQKLFDEVGKVNSVDVLAKPGTNKATLEKAISKVLPPGVRVLSGSAAAADQTNEINQALGFFSTALLVFAFIALFVGGFTIFNTFSIIVGQRTRELALLRIIGASRRQLFRSVLLEAAILGLVASLIGLGLGVLAAIGLKALLGGFGISLPAGPLIFKSHTVVAALAVGVGVTVVSAVGPARRAVKVAPVAAMADYRGTTVESSRRRIITGSAVGIAGVALLAVGLTKPAIQFVGLGAVAVFIGAGMLAPLVARPMASILGRPFMGGISGRLGRENSMRSPRRTAQTAAALMVGLALVSSLTVFGSSLSKSATASVDEAVNADYIITSTGEGQGEFSASVASAASRVPGVTGVSSVYADEFEFRGSVDGLVGVSPQQLGRTIILRLTSGEGPQALSAGELLIDTTTANSDHLSVGATVPVKFALTGATTMRIGGIYKPNALLGSFAVGTGYFRSHFSDPLPLAVVVSSAAPPSAAGEAAIVKGLKQYPNLTIQTKAQFEKSQQKQVDSLLGLVFVLLALAILIALIGIVNTLMLSVFERTREIGLLRAVGMQRRQVKAMIRAEAVILAVFGAVIGVVIGTGLGVAFSASLKQQGITDIAVPIPSLVFFLILAALLGLGAASWPARRAAKLDVLAAIATE